MKAHRYCSSTTILILIAFENKQKIYTCQHLTLDLFLKIFKKPNNFTLKLCMLFIQMLYLHV